MNLTHSSPAFRSLKAVCIVLFLSILACSGPASAVTAVGSIPGQFSVTPSGAASYSIPIEVPPGIGGMQPELSLEYNSQSGNGLLGVGWSLSGLSAITRCPANLAQDGFIDGVDFDGNDRYCLDGQRLVAVVNTGCTGGAEYRTEIDSHARICAYGTQGSGHEIFKVWTKAGQVVEYGVTLDSRIEAQGRPDVLVWAQNRISDSVGNEIRTTYYEDNGTGHYRPSTITYTTNTAAGMAATALVGFDYASRADVIKQFASGGMVSNTLVKLSGVTVKVNNVQVRKYVPSYDNSAQSERSRMTGIQLCDAVNTCLPATTFGWNGGISGASPSLLGEWAIGAGRKWKLADINGDGISDIVRDNAPYGFDIYLSDGNGGMAAATSYSTVLDESWELADFTGDGIPEIITSPENRTDIFQILGGGNTALLARWDIAKENGWRVADFNGDGISDVIRSHTNHTFQVYITDGAGAVSASWNFSIDLGNDWQLGDFNADGVTDVIVQINNAFDIYLLAPDGTISGTQHHAIDAGTGWKVADFNGDGIADIIRSSTPEGSFQVYLTTGTGAIGAVWNLAGINLGADTRSWNIADFNMDGYLDVVRALTNGTQQVFLLDARGGVMAVWNWGFGVDLDKGWDFGDFNGDGYLEEVRYESNKFQFYRAQGSAPDQLTVFTDGVGSQVTVGYSPLTGPGVYEKYTGSLYPVLDVLAAFPVVRTVSASDGIGGTRSSTHDYAGLRVDLHGRGMLGFSKVASTDDTTGIRSVTTYRQDFPYTGQVEKSETYLPNGNLIAQAESSTVLTGTAGVWRLSSSTSTERSYELPGGAANLVSTTTTVNDNYDAYGNVGRVTVTASAGGETSVTQTLNQYGQDDPAAWILGRLTSATVTVTAPDASVGVRTSAFEYDPQTGLLTAEIVEPGNPALELRTAYGHDTYGNTVSTTVSDSGSAQYPIAARTSTTSYDYSGLAVNGTYAVTSTNALGHSETKVIDAALGVVTSLTGPNNLTTQWEYDGFGRKTRELRADGTETTWTYAWCDLACPALGSYTLTRQATGAPPAIEVYDSLGRVIRTSTQGMDGRTIHQDTVYNALGQVSQVSRNYFAGDVVYWTSFVYDLLDRPIEEHSPDGGIVYKTYAGLTSAVRKTAVNGGFDQTVTRVNDVQGNLKQLIDQAGESTYYQYDPHGNLTQVTDIAGNVSAMSYDSRGRKTAMDDPDMGHWDYAYDALGQLRWQRDARQQIVTLDYDKLGRMTGRTEPEGTGTWTYDTAVKGIGKLAEVRFVPAGTSTANYVQTRTYDSLGRPDTTSTSHSGQTLVTRATYDAYGREATFEYPGGFATRNIYNSLGFLTQLENAANAGELYWLAEEADADGQITLELLGNGLETVRMYNAANGTLQGISTGFGSGSAVQYLTYEFDALGNLKQRQDHNASLTEDFTYDVRNRLASATLAGIGTKTYQYDSIGNITAKDGHIDYAYGAGTAGPHAVTTARGNSYQYDANGNMTGGAGRTLQWTSYNKPHTITKGGVTTQFAYGPERDRYRQIETDGSVTRTTLYLGKAYEQITTSAGTEHKYYLGAGGRTIAVRTRKPDASIETRYLHTDHLGSTDAITDEYGTVTERLSFSAFGSRRDATNWQDALGWLTSIATSRGFTGHEQLDKLGLIHMNGRVYDPELGRFLSADPQVKYPASSQGFNRYSYVDNNPLSRVDPTGFGWFKKTWNKIKRAVKRVLQSKVVNWIVQYAVNLIPGIGPIASGLISNFIANYFLTGSVRGALINTFIQPAVDYGAQRIFVGNPAGGGLDLTDVTSGGRTCFASCGDAGIKLPSVGTVVSRIVSGGTIAKLGGGKFANGARTSSFDALFSNISVGIPGPSVVLYAGRNGGGPVNRIPDDIQNERAVWLLSEALSLYPAARVFQWGGKLIARATRGVADPIQRALLNASRVDDRLESTLSDGTKMIFRRDVGSKAHPIGKRYSDPIDHYNIEVHSPIPGRPGRFNQIEDVHIIIDKTGKPIDIIRSGGN